MSNKNLSFSPKSNSNTLSIYAMALCSLFTALIAVGAFIRIQFPVIPITLQTLFVVLAALLLGAKYSSISVGIYLFLGLIGLPVFTKGGGLGYIFQPTFGYLLGFLVSTLVIGNLSRKINSKQSASAIGLKGKNKIFLYYWGIGIVGIMIIYIIGMIYLYLIMNFYIQKPTVFLSLFTFNFLLTIIGDIFKCFVAALLAVRLIPILHKSTQFAKLYL